jgi:hypothetical protein
MLMKMRKRIGVQSVLHSLLLLPSLLMPPQPPPPLLPPPTAVVVFVAGASVVLRFPFSFDLLILVYLCPFPRWIHLCSRVHLCSFASTGAPIRNQL